jgi:hypothetical protein
MKTVVSFIVVAFLTIGISACAVKQNTDATNQSGATETKSPQMTPTFAIGQQVTLYGSYFYTQIDFVTPTPGQPSEYFLFTDEHGNQIVLVPKNTIPTLLSGKRVVVVGEIVKLDNPVTVAVISVEEISASAQTSTVENSPQMAPTYEVGQ